MLKKYIPFLCLLITPVFIYQLFHPKSINDINLSYLSYCPIQSEVVRYLEEEDLYNERINTKFLLSVALKDPLAGYRNTENSFKYVNEGKEDGPAYFIFYNVEQDERKNGFNGKMLKRFEKNHIWFEVWKSGE